MPHSPPPLLSTAHPYPTISGSGLGDWDLQAVELVNALEDLVRGNPDDLKYVVDSLLSVAVIHAAAIEDLSSGLRDISILLHEFMTDPDYVVHLFANGVVKEKVTSDVEEFAY